MDQTPQNPPASTDADSPLTDVAGPPQSSILKPLLYGLLIVGLFSAILFVRTKPAPTPEVFRQDLAVADALDLARESDKPLFAVITADWCGPCQNYKRGALASEEVQAWLSENTLAVMLDADTMSRTDAMLLNFGGSIPATAMVIDGRVAAQFEGSIGEGALMDWLEANTGG